MRARGAHASAQNQCGETAGKCTRRGGRSKGKSKKGRGRGDKDEDYHDTSKGMGNEVDPSLLAESWIVATPQSINAICFRDKRGYHLMFVVGKVKWDLVCVSHHLLQVLMRSATFPNHEDGDP